MKHEDCMCAECRRPAPPPSSLVTIAIPDLPTVVAESVRTVLEAHGMGVVRQSSRAFVTTVDGSEFETLLREIGEYTAAALQGVAVIDQMIAAAPHSRGRR